MGLRALPAEDAYCVSGTLTGITGPGRRTVRRLEVRNLPEGEDLSGLTAFPDLDSLELSKVGALDLAPLTALPSLRRLDIRTVDRLSLGDLRVAPCLEDIALLNVSSVVPGDVELPAGLRTFSLLNDRPLTTGEPVRELIEAIDWAGVPGLWQLGLRVGGLAELPAIHVDLTFLGVLPALERLDLHTGIRHRGAARSPLEPPFRGLSRRLQWLRIDADDPGPLKAQLEAHLGFEPVVYQRS